MNLLKKKIVNWIRKKDPSFKSGSNIIDSTSLDSFDLIDLVTFCEKNFKIKFSDKDLQKKNFSTVKKIIQIINKYKNN